LRATTPEELESHPSAAASTAVGGRDDERRQVSPAMAGSYRSSCPRTASGPGNLDAATGRLDTNLVRGFQQSFALEAKARGPGGRAADEDELARVSQVRGKQMGGDVIGQRRFQNLGQITHIPGALDKLVETVSGPRFK